MAFLVPMILYGSLTAYLAYARKDGNGVAPGEKSDQSRIEVSELVSALYGYTLEAFFGYQFQLPEIRMEWPQPPVWDFNRYYDMLSTTFEEVKEGLGLYNFDEYMTTSRQLTGANLILTAFKVRRACFIYARSPDLHAGSLDAVDSTRVSCGSL